MSEHITYMHACISKKNFYVNVFYKNFLKTSAVSSTNLRSIFIFASCIRTANCRGSCVYDDGYQYIQMNKLKVSLTAFFEIYGFCCCMLVMIATACARPSSNILNLTGLLCSNSVSRLIAVVRQFHASFPCRVGPASAVCGRCHVSWSVWSCPRGWKCRLTHPLVPISELPRSCTETQPHRIARCSYSSTSSITRILHAMIRPLLTARSYFTLSAACRRAPFLNLSTASRTKVRDN